VTGRSVLITGAAGFLGSHLADRLLMAGHDVIGIDNLFTGSKRNIEHLRDQPRFEFIRHDVTFPLYLEVDLIFNLACPASPYWYQKDPVQTLKTSVHGAINMLGLAKRTGATIVQASTSEVYGDPAVSPQPESYWGNVNPIGPRSCYDEGKRAAETLFHDYGRQHGVDARIARIFNTYGPRMAANDGRVVSNFVVQALQGEPLTIYGDGSQTRSFCFVDDLIEGLVRLGTLESAPEGPINLGNEREVTIAEIADLVLALTGSSSGVERLPLPQDDPVRRRPDTTRARGLLAWEATVPLEVGLPTTIEYFRSVLKGLGGTD
jgi:UDP-glucuronate decarboxylase